MNYSFHLFIQKKNTVTQNHLDELKEQIDKTEIKAGNSDNDEEDKTTISFSFENEQFTPDNAASVILNTSFQSESKLTASAEVNEEREPVFFERLLKKGLEMFLNPLFLNNEHNSNIFLFFAKKMKEIQKERES